MVDSVERQDPGEGGYEKPGAGPGFSHVKQIINELALLPAEQ